MKSFDTRSYRLISPILMALNALLLVLSLSAFAGTTPVQSAEAKAEPKQTAKTAKSLKFCVYGDTRDGHEIHKRIVALMLKQNPDLIVQTGDLVRTGSDNSLWAIYDEITGEARKKVPFYSARGNHDVGGTGYEERVTSPYTSGNKLYYSFDKASCHFIALAIDTKSAYDAESAQYKWLIEDLESTKKSKPAHIFVFFHVPPYSIGSHGSDLDVRKVLCPVFQKYGVRAVLTGHDHNYYRTTREGITYIVTGGGGASLYDVHPDQAIEGDKFEKVHNCVVVEVKDKTVSFTALRDDGTTLDSFVLPAK